MEQTKPVVCEICGKPTKSGIDHPGAKVYHLECLMYSPEMVAARKRTQAACPEKAVKD